MACSCLRTRRWLPARLACAALTGVMWVSVAMAAKPGGLLQRQAAPVAASSTAPATESPVAPASSAPAPARPPYQVAERSEAAQAASAAPQLTPAQANEHPLMPTLRWAYQGVGNIQKIQDYSATLAKRERIGGKLLDYEYMFIKLRQKPFSVYMHFLGPPSLKGREVIYVQGQNNGNMWRTERASSTRCSAPSR